ncbi:Hypothetical predicted protein [Cloeon dipterum]|uniref:TGF-beta propeptide domain-containing protein n=1 Tax=Cloeon dipterum TaxID=197152 RepID=A0A8S1C6V0_9INSE|nr:Hypothetical predicted protein [Cloeon dipterum]CAB3363584.1 Hypothetical predicted protein [Cloeon dipterum]
MQSAPLLLLSVAVVAAALPTAALPRPSSESDARPAAKVDNSLRPDETIASQSAEPIDATTPYSSLASKRELDKLRRIQEVKEYIYNSTRSNMGTPYKSQNIMTTNDLKNFVLSMIPETSGLDDPSKKINSFFPLCSPQQSKRVEATKNSDDMYMQFNLTYPPSSPDSKVAIGSANLRLWRINQTESSVSVDPCSPHNQQVRGTPPPTSSTTQPAAEPNNSASSTSTTTTSTTSAPTIISEPREVFVRVTITYLVRQGKKSNKLTRYILDSKMVSTSGEGWVDFNVVNAVKDWQNPNNNMGLFVEVEDQEKKKLPAASFFREMNCTAVSSRVPGGGDNSASADLGGAHMLPMISVCTADPNHAANTDTHAANNKPLSNRSNKDLRRFLSMLQPEASSQKRQNPEDEQLEQVQNTEGHQEGKIRHRHNHHHRFRDDGRPTSSQILVVPLVFKTSRVAEMDEEIELMDQQPITIEQLFQR